MKNKFKQLKSKGFFHIFFSTIINKILGFANGFILVRILTKSEFGMYSYVNNIVLITMIFNGMGITNGVMQFGSETTEENKKNGLFNYALRYGFKSNIIILILMIIIAVSGKLKFEEAKLLLLINIGVPIVFLLLSIIPIYFRVNLENIKFSRFTNISSFFKVLFLLLGAYLFRVKGIFIFNYIGALIAIFIGYHMIGNKKTRKIFKNNDISERDKKELTKFSMISTFNNAVSQLLYLLDVFFIGLIIGKSDIIASYKTATLIPFALSFIPLTIMTFIYPYFARNNKDKKWILSNTKKLILGIGILNLFVSLFLWFLAPFIIKIVFGLKYLDIVPIFRVLVLGYFIAGTFRIPLGNIIVMMRDIKIGFYFSILAGMLNIMLNILLIKSLGSIGAAYATVSVYIVTSLLSIGYFIWKFKIER